MYPDDRVLVGVVNRKRDLEYFLKEHWYRIPQTQMEQGVYAEYLAVYLSGYPAKQKGQSGIYYVAPRAGLELVYRRDLLPEEADHPHANQVYYKLQVGEIEARIPPISNPTKRPISFIFTTWDRFVKARDIKDLYSQADYYVDRIYHALRDKSIRLDRYWDVHQRETGYSAGFRIVCEQGILNAYTHPNQLDANTLRLDVSQDQDQILLEIERKIASLGGVATLRLPPSPR